MRLVGRRRRRHRQRSEDADDLRHRRHARRWRAATSATSSTGGSCCARSSTAAPRTPRGASTSPIASGAPLDLHRSFTPDDDDADIVHFIAQAGLRAPAGLVRPRGHGRDRRRHGPRAPHVPPRRRPLVVGEDRRRRATAACACSTSTSTRPPRSTCSAATRSQRIGHLTDDEYAPRRIGNRIEALVKPIGVVEGISDVPWHKDCSLGHALVQLLQPHRRDLGHRCRRPLGPAPCRRRFAPRARATRVRAPRVGSCRSIDLPTAPATRPCTAAARCTWRSRPSNASAR